VCGWVSVCVGDGGVGEEIIVFEVTLMLCGMKDGIGDKRGEELVVVRLFVGQEHVRCRVPR